MVQTKANDPGAAQVFSLLTADDLYWFNEGTHCRIYQKLGAHVVEVNRAPGVAFSVWAPNAAHVFVMGDFNGWSRSSHPLTPVGSSGVWSGFIARLGQGTPYQFHLVSRYKGWRGDKADPLAFRRASAANAASLVWDLDHRWGDAHWMGSRGQNQKLTRPLSIYEVHLGSWMRVPEEGNRCLGYREVAPKLADYAARHGFTHVELLPVMEHESYESWGYRTSGYFAASTRHGTPQDLMALIDTLHQRGLGVILDWVPSQFAADDHGLAGFDGTPLYEQGGPQKDPRPGWNGYRFNYTRREVRSFLLSNAIFWLDRFHADGLRVGAIGSMLRLDHAPAPGERSAKTAAGAEDVEAVSFLRQLNETVHREFPGVQMYAAESAGRPQVSRSASVGGLGFDLKWDQNFTHNTLVYFGTDPIRRKQRHADLTQRAGYASAEDVVLPYSHGEVAPGQGSLLSKMPGDDWQKFANLRLLLACQCFQPGKKLLFMGTEFGQWNEWRYETSLDWHLVQADNRHNGVQKLVGTLNWLYRAEPALHEQDANEAGFQWLDPNDAEESTLSWLRRGTRPEHVILVVCNFTPVPRHNRRVGAPQGGLWQEIFNSDALDYGGSGQGNLGGVEAAPFPWQNQSHMLTLSLPPLGAVAFKPVAKGKA